MHGRLADALAARQLDLGAIREKPRKKPRPAALTILTTERGSPYSVGWFQHEVSHAIREVGLFGVVAHGWRTTALTWLADAGCSPHQIAAISGHTTLKMIEVYTRGANQRELARAAVVKLNRQK